MSFKVGFGRGAQNEETHVSAKVHVCQKGQFSLAFGCGLRTRRSWGDDRTGDGNDNEALVLDRDPDVARALRKPVGAKSVPVGAEDES